MKEKLSLNPMIAKRISSKFKLLSNSKINTKTMAHSKLSDNEILDAIPFDNNQIPSLRNTLKSTKTEKRRELK